jgi:hypothetical protein
MKVLLVIVMFCLSACSKIDKDDLDIQREDDYHKRDIREDGQKLDR